MDSPVTDKSIRERLRNVDKQTSQMKMRSDMANEEQELRTFFEGLKQPVESDPTLVSKDSQQEGYGQIMQQLDLTNLITRIREYTPRTAEEHETYLQIQRHMSRQVGYGALLGVSVTGMTNWVYRRELGRGVKMGGVMVGIIGGAIFGILQSTEYALRKLEALGPEYQLGRMAITEIEEFRLDNKQFFKDLH